MAFTIKSADHHDLFQILSQNPYTTIDHPLAVCPNPDILYLRITPEIDPQIANDYSQPYIRFRLSIDDENIIIVSGVSDAFDFDPLDYVSNIETIISQLLPDENILINNYNPYGFGFPLNMKNGQLCNQNGFPLLMSQDNTNRKEQLLCLCDLAASLIKQMPNGSYKVSLPIGESDAEKWGTLIVPEENIYSRSLPITPGSRIYIFFTEPEQCVSFRNHTEQLSVEELISRYTQSRVKFQESLMDPIYLNISDAISIKKRDKYNIAFFPVYTLLHATIHDHLIVQEMYDNTICPLPIINAHDDVYNTETVSIVYSDNAIVDNDKIYIGLKKNKTTAILHTPSENVKVKIFCSDLYNAIQKYKDSQMQNDNTLETQEDIVLD